MENILRERLVGKYKAATEQLVAEQQDKVKEMKSKTAISGLLKTIIKPGASSSDDDDDEEGSTKHSRSQSSMNNGAGSSKSNTKGVPGQENLPLNAMNPFKNFGGFAGVLPPTSNGSEGNPYSNEWMKSLPMFPFHVFPGVPPMYRPQAGFQVSANYRGIAPRRMFRVRGRGRGRGGAYFDKNSGHYYNNYKGNKYGEGGDDYSGGESGNTSYYKSVHSSRSRLVPDPKISIL